MTLLIIVQTSDLGSVLLRTLTLYHLLALLDISSSRGVIGRPLALSLATLFLLFLSGLVGGLLGFRALFGLVGLILSICGLFDSLMVPRIVAYLQEMFFFRAPLI